MDKPVGPTSHDVVHRVRRVLEDPSGRHTGTLDPFASGLLVVLVGRATRLARFVEGQPKRYLATARLGMQTTTDDLTGRSWPTSRTQNRFPRCGCEKSWRRSSGSARSVRPPSRPSGSPGSGATGRPGAVSWWSWPRSRLRYTISSWWTIVLPIWLSRRGQSRHLCSRPRPRPGGSAWGRRPPHRAPSRGHRLARGRRRSAARTAWPGGADRPVRFSGSAQRRPGRGRAPSGDAWAGGEGKRGSREAGSGEVVALLPQR